jgi:hypothetical protein
MLPKSDQRRGYESKPEILYHSLVAVKPGMKPLAGQLMRQQRGQEP